MSLPRFSAEVRSQYPTLSEAFNNCESDCDDYETRFEERFSTQRHVGERLSLRDAARLNLMSAHARARVLTWGVIRAINSNSAPTMFLAARAHFEAAGMMAYNLWQSRRFRAGSISSDVLRQNLQRLFLGRRVGMDYDPSDGIPNDETAIQVMQLIDSVDHLFEGEANRELRGTFREAYEWLSELCHPNLQSRIGDHIVDGSDVVFLRNPGLEETDIRMTLNHLRLSDFVLSMAFDDSTKWSAPHFDCSPLGT
jgi:hypothetical protein